MRLLHIMTNHILEELKAKIAKWEKYHPEDVSDDWTCVLCGTRERLTEPHAIGGFGCGNCGQTTMRPTRELDAKEKEKQK
jgi:hypothetical protein